MASDSQSESQDTASSSMVEDSLNISFKDITYSVRNGLLAGGRKMVLAGLSGTFSAGELTVLMGQSGAGKSSLMDILAGYTQQTSGNIFVNDRPRNCKMLRRRSCYILQDDQVQEMLTIPESLAIAAELKLGNHISKELKVKRIEEVIISLGLNRVRHTRAGFLSGGEKKRLAIGLELVSDPQVMFLDEPTSGLDSVMSKQMVDLLHMLARQGRTVVTSIHQPSAALLKRVDRLYAIVAGRCAYMVIEICGERANDLVLYSQNGKDKQWLITSNSSNETDSKLEEDSKLNSEYVFLTMLPLPTESPTNKILSKLKSTYSTSFWKQFTTLTRRSVLVHWRNPQFTLIMTGIHIMMAVFVGTLFYNIGEDARFARDNFNCLYFGLMFLMFTAFSGVTVSFPEQVPVIRREHFNRWYMSGAYCAATLISSIPTQTICTLSYGCIVYWLTGQPHDFLRFTCYSWTLMLVSYVALCIGLLNGSLFNVKNGVIFGPFFIMPFVIFSGFFLLYSDAPAFFKWFFHISFLKHGLVALTIAVFGMDRPKLTCTDLICRYTYPKQMLIEREMTDENLWFSFISLMCISVVVNFSTYVILKIRLKSKW